MERTVQQQFFLKRFERLVRLNPATPENRKLLGKARYSTYQDCVALGLQDDAQKLRERATPLIEAAQSRALMIRELPIQLSPVWTQLPIANPFFHIQRLEHFAQLAASRGSSATQENPQWRKLTRAAVLSAYRDLVDLGFEKSGRDILAKHLGKFDQT